MVRNLLVVFLKLGVAVYTVQLLVVAFWHLFPVTEARDGGKVYKLQRGFGDLSDLMPVIGLMPVLGETVTLTITDEANGKVETEYHDEPDSVYFDHSEVFKRHGIDR